MLEDILSMYLHWKNQPGKPQKGYAFEKILARLFEYYNLNPSPSFRLVGEQIDGAFSYKNKHFLVEAKWQKEKVSASQLYAFKGKVDGKPPGVLGLFISISGFTRNSVLALKTGKTMNIILMDGDDIEYIVRGKTSPLELLDAKIDALMFQGEPCLSVEQLFPGRVKEHNHCPHELRIVQGPAQGAIYAIVGKHLLGRGGGMQTIDTGDVCVSRVHAALVLDDDGYVYLKDLGNCNGTFLNGELLRKRQKLKDGDEIRIGMTLLVYRRFS